MNTLFLETKQEVFEMGDEQLTCPLTRGERILVAVDGSIYSERALDQAISMAKVCNSSLFAICVLESYPKSLAPGLGVEEKIKKEAGGLLEKVKEKAAEENVSCETIVHVGGQPHQFIVKEAKERDIDGVCLLGEVPGHLSRIENPMAALAILKVLTKILDIEIDTTELAETASEAKEQMKQATAMAMGEYIEHFTHPIWEHGDGEEGEEEEEEEE